MAPSHCRIDHVPKIRDGISECVSEASMYLVIIKNGMGAELVRTIGIVRARCKIGMTNLVYNMRRLVYLERRGGGDYAEPQYGPPVLSWFNSGLNGPGKAAGRPWAVPAWRFN
jgi:hypothetical protein